ncbi:MAG: hypothetical protein WCI30_06685 [Clostridia bacterium]
MKIKKTLLVVCSAALIGTMGVTAFAANLGTTAGSLKIAENKQTTAINHLADQNVKKALLDAAQKKWTALTVAQKSLAYALQQEVTAVNNQVIDQYLVLGLINQTTATEMKTRISENEAKMQADGKLPLFGLKQGPQGPRGERPTLSTTKGSIDTNQLKPVLTADELAAHETEKTAMDELQKKWVALTAAQKETIYALQDKVISIEGRAIDQYLSLGLIDQATATEMRTRLSERAGDVRTNDRIPMFGNERGGRAEQGVKQHAGRAEQGGKQHPGMQGNPRRS